MLIAENDVESNATPGESAKWVSRYQDWCAVVTMRMGRCRIVVKIVLNRRRDVVELSLSKAKDPNKWRCWGCTASAARVNALSAPPPQPPIPDPSRGPLDEGSTI
jgi:hypothetical protein